MPKESATATKNVDRWLFDMRPIELEGFTLRPDSVEAKGHPTQEQWEHAMEFCTNVGHASGWWLADLIVYADERPDWKQDVEELVDNKVITEGSIKVYRFVAKHVPKERRVKGVGFTLHQEVASLPAEEQTEWLEKTKVEGWTRKELRHRIKATKRETVLEGDAGLTLTADEAVKLLRGITGQDPDADHTKADDILLRVVPEVVANAYRRLKQRAKWWATS